MTKQDIKQTLVGAIILLGGLVLGCFSTLAFTHEAISPLHTEHNQNVIRDIPRDYGISWDTLDTDMYPYWEEADSLCGKDSRGTDLWISTAIAEQPNNYDYNMNIDSAGAFIYDYNNRYVGHITWDRNTQLDTLMQMDNI